MKRVLAVVAILAMVGTTLTRAAELTLEDADGLDETAIAAWAPSAPGWSSSGLCCYPPRWTVSAGAIFLERNDPQPRTLLVDPISGAQLMNTLDLAPYWGSGPRLEVTRHLDNGVDFEVELFNIDDWAGHAHAQNARPSINESYWDQFVFNDVGASFNSHLFNLECNLRWNAFGSRWLRALAGFRYASLDERFGVNVGLNALGTTFTNWGNLKVDNDLYGFQIGIEPVLWDPAGPLRLEGFLKTGIYGNHADWLLTTGGDLDNRQWDKTGSNAAFIGELSLKLSYDFCFGRGAAAACGGDACGEPGCGEVGCGECGTCPAAACGGRCRRMTVFAGYEALWLTGVATIEQWKRTVRFDDAFYHGVYVGIEVPLGRGACCGGTSRW